MKHLKTYRLFESTDVVMAGVENAIKNHNYELLFDLFKQHGDMIDPNKLVKIFLSNNKNFEFLNIIPKRYLEKVTELWLSSKLEDLSILQKFPNLEMLSLFRTGLTSLKGVEHLTNLRTFSVQLDDIKSVEPLSGLTKLKLVTIVGCDDLENIEPLKTLVNLVYLDVAENGLKSFKGIENLPNLKSISLLENDLPKELDDQIWSILDPEREDQDVMDKQIVDLIQNYYKDETH